MTGGTIASEQRFGAVALAQPPEKKLRAAYENSGGAARLSFEAPLSIHSEQLSAESLNKIVSCVKRAYESGCKRLIVCHGTDTLQYTACAVMLLLAQTDCRCVFVSSALPLDEEGSNGYENFLAAAAFLEKTDLEGVYISYKNSGQPARLYPAKTVCSHPEASDEVRCLCGEYAAEYSGGSLEPCAGFEPPRVKKPPFDTVFPLYSAAEALFVHPGKSIAPCRPGTRAVLLRPFHSGTLPTGSAEFRNFCRGCAMRGIKLFVCDVPRGRQYESSLSFDELGIIPLPGASFIPVYTALWLASSLEGDELERFIRDEFC